MVPAAIRSQRPQGWLLVGLACALGGCMGMLDVQTLATGRHDVSAYALNGSDLDALRREAQRLCPLGGEILRQSGQQQRPELTDGRWRKALNATAAWVNPPQQSAQLVLVCRAPGDRSRLQAAVAPVPASASAPAPAPAAKPAASPPVAPATQLLQTTAALPIGPITPEW